MLHLVLGVAGDELVLAVGQVRQHLIIKAHIFFHFAFFKLITDKFKQNLKSIQSVLKNVLAIFSVECFHVVFDFADCLNAL